jgi:hypothetical protein
MPADCVSLVRVEHLRDVRAMLAIALVPWLAAPALAARTTARLKQRM